ncbi:MAG: T9SS type A sorting domain-containing protein [Bacteroidales bacterium]|nr:T9SS type A sorting domain-containing protein [Bacteroidales bacterium]
MKIKKYFSILLILNIYLFVNAQTYSSGDSLVIFYPDDFDSVNHFPSFAIINEPEVSSGLPAEWELTPDFSSAGGREYATISIDEGIDLYGTGEVTGPLRRNNTSITLWNTDNYAYGTDNGRRLYQSHPFLMGVRADGSSFGIIADNTWKMYIDLTDTEIIFSSEGPSFRVIIYEASSPMEVVQQLSSLTGKIDLPPMWALGYHQCRYSYYPDSRVREIADEFRNRKLPCDVIWMDIDYMDGFRIFTFHPTRFPDPDGLNSYLHDLDFKSIWMIDPGVKEETGYFVYDQGTSGDYWVQTNSGTEYNGNVWPGSCAFPDFTMPDAQDWWAGLYPDFIGTGIDGVWNDMNEPSVFSESSGTMPENNHHRGGGELPEGSHLRYHNVYGYLMVRSTREGIILSQPDKRPFVLTRSNFLGGQRYAATWTGDNVSSWEHMQLSVPMSLTLSLSGQPLNGPDVGGYVGSPGAELLGHWMALGAFYPFYRNHTGSGTANQEPWAQGTETEEISRVALQRRYRLMPYLYTQFYKASTSGIPVMQPVFFADTDDADLRDEQEVFLFGSDLLIIPKWAESPSLPKSDTWRSISIVGEDSKNDPVQPDVRLKSGAIIPLGNIIQNTAEFSTDSVTLLISLDESYSAQGILYEDSGDGYEYQSGNYLIRNFTAEDYGIDSIRIICSREEGSLELPETNYHAGIVTSYSTFYSEWTTDTVIYMERPVDVQVEITSPLANSIFETDSNITITATAASDADIAQLDFYANGTELIGTVSSAPYAIEWISVPAGHYNLKAVAVIDEELQVESDPVPIVVGTFGEGSVLYQVWDDIPGPYISNLTSDERYPDSPSSSSFLTSFEAPIDVADNFGSRIIGYVHPPSSGYYTFTISGDDYCELWLSSSEAAGNLEMIAEVPGWTNPYEWGKYPEQQSDEIWLVSGNRYLIQALHKEELYGDNVAVAWESDVIPFEIIPGDYLSPYDATVDSQTIRYYNREMEISPNPASDYITIEITNVTGTYNAVVYDIIGKKVMQFNHAADDDYQLPVFSLPNGMYYLEVKARNFLSVKSFIIVKK